MSESKMDKYTAELVEAVQIIAMTLTESSNSEILVQFNSKIGYDKYGEVKIMVKK